VRRHRITVSFQTELLGSLNGIPNFFEGICNWVREFACTSYHKSYAGGSLVTGGTTNAR